MLPGDEENRDVATGWFISAVRRKELYCHTSQMNLRNRVLNVKGYYFKEYSNGIKEIIYITFLSIARGCA